MQITSISNNYKYHSSYPVFKSSQRQVLDKSGNLLYKNVTSFFRNDLAWRNFSGALDRFFASADKVNVFNFACSDGSEPWSLAISLIEKLGEKAQKFFPIRASDFDKEIILKAKQKPCAATTEDLYNINMMTSDNYSKYFSCHRIEEFGYLLGLRPKEILKEKVEFKQSDIFDEISNIPLKNNLILCRNFWPYLSEEKREELARLLSEKLDKTSLLVIGSFDKGHNIKQLLEQYGFEEVLEYNVFRKMN